MKMQIYCYFSLNLHDKRIHKRYEALVNKRQYKSHIGISDALKIIIEHTQPTPEAPLNTGFTKAGKNNKKVVKKLLKVVIDDIEYELSSTMDYADYLKKQIERYKKIAHYLEKKNSAKNEKERNYYDEYMKMYFIKDESIDNFEQLYQEVKSAYDLKQSHINDLNKEIKIIKKLNV